jgi:hypothetical protein
MRILFTVKKTTFALFAALMVLTPAHSEAKHKGFVLSSDDGGATMTISGRVQARYTYESVEGIDAGADDKSSLKIARARLKLTGQLFEERVTYYFQTDFGKGQASLKDFFTDYVVDKKWLRIRAGQWKRPFSRQQLTSSGTQELVDRAITDSAFLAGRDIGVSIHNHYIDSPEIEYALGVFNGNGIKAAHFADRFNPTLVARLGYNYGGIKGYSEADFEGGDFRFAVGASGLMNLDVDEDDVDDSGMMGQVDLMVKLRGLTTSAAFYYSKGEGESLLDGKPIADAIGFHGQLGYLLAGKYQPVARYAMVKYKRDGNVGESTATEMAVGLSIYPHRHNYKWQTDVAMLSSKADGADTKTDYMIRTQLQLAF